MIDELLKLDEGSTVEFKENTKPLESIAKTVIAFANTAGGKIVIGIEGRTRKIIGVEDVVEEEERIVSSLLDLIAPVFLPTISVVTHQRRSLMVIEVPPAVGPLYLKSAGPELGTYVRFGSTNRVADGEMRRNLLLLAQGKTFDELPIQGASLSILDWPVAEELFLANGKKLTKAKAHNLGITVDQGNSILPSNGGVLLFGKDRFAYFPASIIRCARFGGTDKEDIIDELEIDAYLPLAIDPALKFVQRNTRIRIEIGEITHEKIPQYPTSALKEAITNSIVHADYSIKGSSIMIAIFDDRIEITNPGGLVFSLTLEKALAGSSRLRNRVIGKVFKNLNLIEEWGSGLRRIISKCLKAGLPRPKFEVSDNEFKVTIFGIREKKVPLLQWQEDIIQYLREYKRISTRQAVHLLGLSAKTVRGRLNELVDLGLLMYVTTSEKDPQAYYILVYDPLQMDEMEED